MIALNLKRNKIATGLTCSAPSEVIDNWNVLIPRILIHGPTPPVNPAGGVRYVKSDPNPPVRNLLGAYLFQIPGLEVCFLANPDVYVGGDATGLLGHVDGQRMEMAWACHCDLDGKPRGFVLSSSVIPHIMREIPTNLTFNDDWLGWVAGWMTLRMSYRYFDATRFGIVHEIPKSPVMNAYDIPVETKPEEKVAVKVKKKNKK